jgi:CMP-N-acetylneuraminic acid synthetase
MDKFIALVPMKAHSVRLKNKNIKDMAGHPLFYYILKTLEKYKYISEIYINTDSDVIKGLLHENFRNVNIISRPKHLIGNNVPMNAIIDYDLSQIDGDNFLQTHSTNPLLKSTTIEKSIEFFVSHREYDSLFSVTKLQKRFFDSKGNPINHDPKNLLNTQDLPPLFEENACIFLFTRKSFKSNKHRVGKNPYMFEINKLEAIDIDDELDFELAQKIIQTKKSD